MLKLLSMPCMIMLLLLAYILSFLLLKFHCCNFIVAVCCYDSTCAFISVCAPLLDAKMCFIVFIRHVTYKEVLSHVLKNWQLDLLTFNLTYLPYHLPFRRAFICHDGYCLAAIMCYIVHIVASMPLSFSAYYFYVFNLTHPAT